MSEEKNKKSFIRDIARKKPDETSPLENVVKTVNMSTYGTNGITGELEDNMKVFRGAVADMLKNSDEGFDKGVMGALSNYYKASNDEDAMNNLQQVMGIGENSNDVDGGLMSIAYSSYASNIQKFKDIELVVKMIPQLQEAIDITTDSIMASDSSNNLVSFKNLSETQFAKIKDIDTRYKLYEKLAENTRNALTYGYGYTAIIPYSKAFEEFKMNDENYRRTKEAQDINDRNARLNKIKGKRGSNPLSESFDFEAVLSEGNISITEDNSTAFDSIKSSTEEFLSNVQLCEGAHHLCEFKNSGEVSLLSEVTGKMNKINEKLNGLNKDKKKQDASNITADGLKSANTTPDKLTGCVFKVLNTKNVIPIRVEDVNIGYYYVEDLKLLDNINMNVGDPMSALNSRASMDPNAENERVNGAYFKQLANTITKSIVKDKKFLEDNARFKEELYSILKYGNMIDKTVKITYIPADQIVQSGNGYSMIDRSLWYAKLYLALMITNIVIKLSRGYDKRVYYVKSSVAPELAKDTNLAIAQVKKDQRSVTVLNSVNKILNIAGRTTDLFIPTDNSGNKSIEMDVMAGQDTAFKDELMEFLEERTISGTGVPTPLIQATTDVDFAKGLDMLNRKHLRRCMAYQKLFNPSVNLIFNKINAYDQGLEIEDPEYDVVPVEYQPSNALATQVMNEQVGNSKDLVDIIVRTYTDNGTIDENAIGLFTRKLMREMCPNLPHDKIDRMFNESIEEAKLDKAKNPSEEEGM